MAHSQLTLASQAAAWRNGHRRDCSKCFRLVYHGSISHGCQEETKFEFTDNLTTNEYKQLADPELCNIVIQKLIDKYQDQKFALGQWTGCAACGQEATQILSLPEGCLVLRIEGSASDASQVRFELVDACCVPCCDMSSCTHEHYQLCVRTGKAFEELGPKVN